MSSTQSVHDVIERDRAGEFESWEDFDDALWIALCTRVNFDSPEAILQFPEAIGVYFATRLLEWEVGNGGFAQAAMNFPGWFELAAKGNQALGKPQLAAFIRSAGKLAADESKNIDAAHKDGLEGAFEYFREGTFDTFDDQLEEIGWECGEDRIKYVRAHRDQFSSL